MTEGSTTEVRPARPRRLVRVRLALRIWRIFLGVQLAMRRERLPLLVDRLGRAPRRRGEYYPVGQLSRTVYRRLQFGRRLPTCLVRALVLYRLLREQGDPAVVVIGLPEGATDPSAHAWVELDGVDVGPPPGRGEHVSFARFG